MISIVHAFSIRDVYDPPFESLGQLISTILPNVFILAGIIVFLLFIGGGFMVIANAGKGQKEGVAKGQKAVTYALVGFILIIGSYWIIQIISVITGLNILNPSFPIP